MAYYRENYRRIREQYQTKYLRAREDAETRRMEAENRIPELKELDQSLGQIGLRIMETALSAGQDRNEMDTRMQQLRMEHESMQNRRRALLVSHGYSPDHTEPHYECPLCGDTGYVDCRMCRCMKQKLIEAGFETSGMKELLRTQSFENFSLHYYDAHPPTRQHMEKVLRIMKQYADTFRSGSSGNLVLFGGTGLGKTHLSSAVARCVIEGGWDVFYTGSVACMSDFEYQRFGHAIDGALSTPDLERYYTCDLLILDDLGTEVSNQFTTSVLYQLINSRLNHQRATIISTNLTQDEFRRRYWDRITSRVLGEYTVLPFVGTDIRLQKKNS